MLFKGHFVSLLSLSPDILMGYEALHLWRPSEGTRGAEAVSTLASSFVPDYQTAIFWRWFWAKGDRRQQRGELHRQDGDEECAPQVAMCDSIPLDQFEISPRFRKQHTAQETLPC